MGERYDEGEAERLREELRAFGRSLDGRPGGPHGAAGPESMAERVLGQILAERVPAPVAEPTGARARLRAVRRWAGARWRSLVAALCGVLTVVVLTPPVRAAVTDWFGFGGVEVRYDPSAVPSPGAEVPGCGRSVSLGEAERRAGFAPLVPEALGTPDAVTVSGLPRGRSLVSLCWREKGRTIRLDEFPGRLDIAFTKSVREQPELLSPGAGGPAGGSAESALWFSRPHVLTFWMVDTDGHRFTRAERTAGPTLLWGHTGAAGSEGAAADGVTLRLEGVASKARALEIAGAVGEADG
ncbi:hypothetical protein HTV45_12530 [Streptomyces sp. CHD11]|uniref:hypothetical protein n=1 Tax=Streptomyces sp. CHD11 TaxID=2741325 RepID=UPI001BFC5B3F|nr:hypothetical protein [Streptomyces sp. CHD11]MBT3151702.1 hypothetical protein [Streptomyces sp. CHD11]